MIKPGLALLACLSLPAVAAENQLSAAIARDYKTSLEPLFNHLHANPELSYMEVQTAARMARELRAAGFEVTEGVGKTGLVAILRNGKGPTVMVRADMDALPVEEKSDAPHASRVKVKDLSGNLVPVMHACGHDVHMTSLVGTAHQMAARQGDWKGTLMLVGQPAEERTGGALDMMADGIYKRFGKPDYALSLHVGADIEAGRIEAGEAPFSGADLMEIVVHGIGTHGASPHTGKDPVVIASQIVLALQTVVTRDIAPREAALITVGSFHAGTKGNVISDTARLELTVRSESDETRAKLLEGIKRVAEHTARAAGVPEDKLPEIRHTDRPVPPTLNDKAMLQRLRSVWSSKLGEGIFDKGYQRGSMVGEDYAHFIYGQGIPSVYFMIGGTPPALVEAARAGKASIAYNHSPLFRADAEKSIQTGVLATTVALLDLMKK
ncbi:MULTISPECIES: amidohydrolase [unclassified Duganella]|uniref:amidohydrolase n=1 Tax=unclassified Duganella TaxID=2636909 RepID=UPI0006F40CF0|nr:MULTISPECIES: amidohydrolase [unclassified Duganella]KQV54173.1 peptidase M20 [Duganella sp. Root336D2]KRC03302.1 peptidase M20 [Duganella sp. Root198D2]